jgi:hypothetical protein
VNGHPHQPHQCLARLLPGIRYGHRCRQPHRGEERRSRAGRPALGLCPR